MLNFLETGRALYVLMAICVLGIVTRGITKHFYKRLVKESSNLSLTKNKSLKDLRQKAENTYRMNQGMRDTSSWLEHQLYDLRVMGVSLQGWSNLCMQWTWLTLILGGGAAFASYWFRLDTFYIVMYGGGAVLMAMLTMLFDNGVSGGWREQLLVSLQDYMENVMCPRLARNISSESLRGDGGASDGAVVRKAVRTPGGFRRAAGTSPALAAGNQAFAPSGSQTAAAISPTAPPEKKGGTGSLGGAGGPGRRKGKQKVDVEPESTVRQRAEATEQDRRNDVDYIKRSLEQIAASREKNRVSDENWLKDLKPEEVELIGDILKQYLA